MNDTLDAHILSATNGFAGRVSVYAENIDTGAAYGLGEDTRVQTASTIKVAILAAAHAEVAAGRASWADTLTLTEAGKAYGAGVLCELGAGLTLTLRDAVHLMMVISDNTATNLVLAHLSTDTVNDYLDTLGLPEIRCLRHVGGGGESPAFYAPENAEFGIGVATPRSMARLLTLIARGRVVSPEASGEMLDLMGRQQRHYGIGRGTEGSPVANKPGALDRLRSDVGIVGTERGQIVLAITCDHLPETLWGVDCPAYQILARLSELLVISLSSMD